MGLISSPEIAHENDHAYNFDVTAEGYSPNDDLFVAAKHGDLDVVRFLCEGGEDMELMHDGGWTPLIISAAYNQLDVVRYLVDSGADIDRARQDGVTPLSSAGFFGHLEVVRFLCESGANME